MYCFCHYFPYLSLLCFHKIRDRISFFFLYEKVCNTAFDPSSYCSVVLLSKANADEKYFLRLVFEDYSRQLFYTFLSS